VRRLDVDVGGAQHDGFVHAEGIEEIPHADVNVADFEVIQLALELSPLLSLALATAMKWDAILELLAKMRITKCFDVGHAVTQK
jgi:hypothetical protein